MRGDPSSPADWLAYALRDLSWARNDMAREDFQRAMPTLQQAAKKLLKSWLIARGWELVRTHDLAALASKADSMGAEISWFIPTAANLTEEFFAERYPGDFDPPPTPEEAQSFASDVERLFAHLRSDPGNSADKFPTGVE